MGLDTVKYIALGDSYTIGEGAKTEEAWPNLMVKELSNSGLDIQLIANPSVTGWTTKDLIEKELPIFDENEVNFVTLLIGVNDWVQEVEKEKFKENLDYIITHILKKVEREKVLLVTIPDFSVTPEGPKYSKGRNISDGLKDFNSVIEDAALKNDFAIADLFTVSQEMSGKPEMIADDGLHPSALTYARWCEIITPKAKALFGLN